MAGREVREYTNLTDPKDKKWGKGKDKIDDEDITFHRMVAKGFGLSSWVIDAIRCKRLLENVEAIFMAEAEQMEAEEDAERLLRRTEKRAFAVFKQAACLADSSPASIPLPLRVEPKPKSGIRQQVLLRKVIEVKPKRPRQENLSDRNQSTPTSSNLVSEDLKSEADQEKKEYISPNSSKAKGESNDENPVKCLLGLEYASSDGEDD